MNLIWSFCILFHSILSAAPISSVDLYNTLEQQAQKGKVTVSDAKALLDSPKFNHLNYDDTVLDVFSLAKRLLDQEIELSEKDPSFSFKNYFHSAQECNHVMDHQIKSILADLVGKSKQQMITEPVIFQIFYEESAMIESSPYQQEALLNFGSPCSEVLPVTAVWRYYATQKIRLAFTSSAITSTSYESIVHTAVGLLKLIERDSGIKQFSEDIDSISHHVAILSVNREGNDDVAIKFKDPSNSMVMHYSVVNSANYPISNALVYYDKTESLDNAMFDRLSSLDANKRTLVDIVEDVINILADVNTVQDRFQISRDSLKLLYLHRVQIQSSWGDVNVFKGGSSIKTYISISASRLLKKAAISQNFLDSNSLNSDDFIILVQQYHHSYKHVQKSVLVTSKRESLDGQSVTKILEGSIPQSTLSSKQGINIFPGSIEYNEMYFNTSLSPTNLLESLKTMLRAFQRPVFCPSCCKLFEEVKGKKVRQMPCTNNECRKAHIDCSGSELKQELQRAPVVSDFLISILYLAASPPKPEDIKFTLYPVPIGIGYYSGTSFVGFNSNENISQIASKLIKLLDEMPSVNKMLEYNGSDLDEFLNRINKMLAPLLKWILRSQYAILSELTNPNDRINGLNVGTHFKIELANPKTQLQVFFNLRTFDSQLAQATGATKTIFAFHGSPASNWHSILHNGFNLNRTTHGRRYGDGICELSINIDHAHQFETSWQYAIKATKFWRSSTLRVENVVALNEIVYRPDKFLPSSEFVVVPANLVRPRFLIVVSTTADQTSLNKLRKFDSNKIVNTGFEGNTRIVYNGKSLKIPTHDGSVDVEAQRKLMKSQSAKNK